MYNMFFVLLFSLGERSEGAAMMRKWFSSVQTVGERRKPTVHLDFRPEYCLQASRASVLWIRKYFFRIRIRGSVILDYGSADPGGQ